VKASCACSLVYYCRITKACINTYSNFEEAREGAEVGCVVQNGLCSYCFANCPLSVYLKQKEVIKSNEGEPVLESSGYCGCVICNEKGPFGQAIVDQEAELDKLIERET
jgi:hypothetical protein